MNRIKSLRTALGLKQKQLAEHVGISTSYLNQIENETGGKRPSVDLMMRIAKVLDVDLNKLVSHTPELAACVEDGIAKLNAGLRELPEEKRAQAIHTLLSVMHSFKPVVETDPPSDRRKT